MMRCARLVAMHIIVIRLPCQRLCALSDCLEINAAMKLVLLLPLLLGVSSHGAKNTQPCSIIRHPTEHSTYSPDFSGTVNFTLWQVFCTTNANSSEGNFSSSWVVTDPHPPKAENDTNLLDCEYTVDHCPVCRNASITLYNATDYDWGNYMVTIQKPDCSSNTSTFRVRFPHCSGSPPEPTTPNRTLVLAEPRQRGHCLELVAACYGDKDLDHYDERWTNAAGKLLCADDFAPSPGKYTCNRTDMQSMCNFTEHFWINDYSKSDSGVYCVQAYSVIGSAVGNKSCVDLTVVPQPWGVAIDTSTRHIHLGTHHVSLQFKLANYSQTTQQYINLTFLRDDEVINPTQERYCMTTSWTDPFDSSVATVELQVPWSKPGKYKMRINYTSDVDTEGSGFSPYDTQSIKVKSERLWEMIGAISGSLAGGIMMCCICVCCCYNGRYKRLWKKWKRCSRSKDDAQKSLISSVSDIETDSSHRSRMYGATQSTEQRSNDLQVTVGNPVHDVLTRSFLAMCVEEGEIEDAELVKIAERIDADYIKQLAILLLDSEKRFKDIRSELNSRGDHKPTNLCLDVLNAWKVNTPADAMRQKLVIALLELKCDDVAKTVATKNYSQTPSICLLRPTSSSGNRDSGGKQ